MFEYETIGTTRKLSINDIWEKYLNVSKWPSWDDSITQSSIQGPFETGSKGTLLNRGMPPLEFSLTEVIPYTSFTNESNLGPFTVKFTHHLSTSNDEVVVRHGIKVIGPDPKKVEEIGTNISNTIPGAIKNLLEKTHE